MAPILIITIRIFLKYLTLDFKKISEYLTLFTKPEFQKSSKVFPENMYRRTNHILTIIKEIITKV